MRTFSPAFGSPIPGVEGEGAFSSHTAPPVTFVSDCRPSVSRETGCGRFLGLSVPGFPASSRKGASSSPTAIPGMFVSETQATKAAFGPSACCSHVNLGHGHLPSAPAAHGGGSAGVSSGNGVSCSPRAATGIIRPGALAGVPLSNPAHEERGSGPAFHHAGEGPRAADPCSGTVRRTSGSIILPPSSPFHVKRNPVSRETDQQTASVLFHVKQRASILP